MMTKKGNFLNKLLEEEYKKYNKDDAVSQEKLDPILIAKKYNDETISLICALFAYGNVKAIVKFLESLDFSLIDGLLENIDKALKNHYYRFQKSKDIIGIFKALKKLKDIDSIENIFLKGYKKENSVLDGLNILITTILDLENINSQGYNFLVGKPPNKDKTTSASAHKRWNMYLRWMVRNDNVDLGLWSGVSKKDLILPLDTHTFKVSQKLGLLDRKTYDLKSAILITDRLRKIDPLDPIKFDFALYRIGQNKIL
jgi:uncharacterized protein (TIGR02757 family)